MQKISRIKCENATDSVQEFRILWDGGKTDWSEHYSNSQSRTIDLVNYNIPEGNIVWIEVHVMNGMNGKIKESIEHVLYCSNVPSVAAYRTTGTALSFNVEFLREQINIPISNAGLCLFSPYFSELFAELNYLDKDKRFFKNTAFQIRAVFLLQYLINLEEKRYLKTELAFNCLLIGLPSHIPLPEQFNLTEKEKVTARNLFNKVRTSWKKIDTISMRDFQEKFIFRKGLLKMQEMNWELTIDDQMYDIMLDTIPQSFKKIRFPWLEKYIQVFWHRRKEDNTFTKDFWKYLAWFAIIVILILILPFLFTSPGSERLNFRETGQIGDTIGGIVGPFVAIAAALLTFFAFWVQYKANMQQRNDIRIERFENKFFNYIQLLNNQISDSYIPNVGNNKQSYHYMFYEFKSICYYLQTQQYLLDIGCTPNTQQKSKAEIFKCAYIMFINGGSLSATDRITEECNCYSMEELKLINNFFHKFNEQKGKNNHNLSNNKKLPLFLHWLYKNTSQKSNNRLDKNGSVQYLRDYKTEDIQLFDGHRLRLIPFYRSICIIIKYLHEEIYSHDSWENHSPDHTFEFYINLLCSQLSEHQIGLLKIIYKYSNNSSHIYFTENDGVKNFFSHYINEYLRVSTMDCDKWNFK